MRLQIKPGLRQVWRGPGTVQIGLTPGRGAVLAGLAAPEVRMLTQLSDGGVDPVHVLSGGVAPGDSRAPGEAAASGEVATSDAHPPRSRELLRLLASANILMPTKAGRAALTRLGPARLRLADDAAVWSLAHPSSGDAWELLAARASRTVLIVGAGRVAEALTQTLASCAVGTIDTLAELPDPWVGNAAACVVLVGSAVADARRAEPLVRADVAHLSVVVRETDVVVGPMVSPGRGPCLRCLDLHRADRDPLWPTVLAQLLALPAPQPQESALARAAGALAALQVLGQLDGIAVPAAVGHTLELELPDGLVSRRPWPVHAGCGCHWPPHHADSWPDLPARRPPAATMGT